MALYTGVSRKRLSEPLSQFCAFRNSAGKPISSRISVILRGCGREIPSLLLLNRVALLDRKSTRLNSSHSQISYAVFCLKKKKTKIIELRQVRLHNRESHERSLMSKH